MTARTGQLEISAWLDLRSFGLGFTLDAQRGYRRLLIRLGPIGAYALWRG